MRKKNPLIASLGGLRKWLLVLSVLMIAVVVYSMLHPFWDVAEFQAGPIYFWVYRGDLYFANLPGIVVWPPSATWPHGLNLLVLAGHVWSTSENSFCLQITVSGIFAVLCLAAAPVYRLTTTWITLRRNAEIQNRLENFMCVKCNYNLRGVSERCPECGHPFEKKRLWKLNAETEKYFDQVRRADERRGTK